MLAATVVLHVCTLVSPPCDPSTLSQVSAPGVTASATPSILTPARLLLLRVGHPGRRGAVVQEAHDAGDAVHTEVIVVVLAALVEHLLPLGHRTAVRPQKSPDRPHGTAPIHQEGALAAGKREGAPRTRVRAELALGTVEDVDAGRGAAEDVQAALPPAVHEGEQVVGSHHRRALGIRPAENL